ncbi:MAG: type III pantothenate kinase [Gammaproteobacteria bacterium]
MILLVDIGNSRIKWASLIKKRLEHRGNTTRRKDPTTLAADLEQAWRKVKKPQAVVVSSVAGSAYAEALSAWTTERWQLQPRFVTAERTAFEVTNAYSKPERLGADRWAALIAARRRRAGAAACIVDAGTAVTIDVISAQGVHQGGLIIPGLAMMRHALLEQTEELLPATEEPVSGDVSLLARDTRDGVNGGTLYALVAVIDRVIADVRTELGTDLTRIITGGDAETLLPLLAGNYHHHPDLVLEGLAVIAEES